MTEWWTYRPSDFLMFAPETYWRLVERYNLDVWPLQLLALALRALVLQYIGLTAVGAYSSLYRGHASERPAADPARSVHDADRAQLAHPIDAGSHAVRQARGEAG